MSMLALKRYLGDTCSDQVELMVRTTCEMIAGKLAHCGIQVVPELQYMIRVDQMIRMLRAAVLLAGQLDQHEFAPQIICGVRTVIDHGFDKFGIFEDYSREEEYSETNPDKAMFWRKYVTAKTNFIEQYSAYLLTN
jgi:hypothetical protein